MSLSQVISLIAYDDNEAGRWFSSNDGLLLLMAMNTSHSKLIAYQFNN